MTGSNSGTAWRSRRVRALDGARFDRHLAHDRVVIHVGLVAFELEERLDLAHLVRELNQNIIERQDAHDAPFSVHCRQPPDTHLEHHVDCGA
jgi:hypothetical protein